jgi:NTE family protein
VNQSAWGVVLLGAMLAGCATTPTAPATPPAPPKVALVLGGGAARGFAHVGVIKVLQGHGIEPDLVVGTSAGCVAGSFYAAGYSGFDMQELAFGLDRAMVADWSPFGRGLIKGEALQTYVDDAVHHVTMQGLKRRFACVAVKLRSGEAVIMDQGDVGQVVRASSSVPGVFEPTSINGEDYVDGGLRSPVPIREARALGADIVIAVDVASPPAQDADSKLAVLHQAIAIMTMGLREDEVGQADVLISPQLGGITATDFKDRQEAILAGERAAQAALPQIQAKLAAHGLNPGM